MTSYAIHLHKGLQSALKIRTDNTEYTNDLHVYKWIAYQLP